jgi:hypothetical protein
MSTFGKSPENDPMKSLLPLLVSSLALCMLPSCGVGPYSQDFGKANIALARPPTDAEGPWRGTWLSKVNGHTGPIWCIVQPTPDKPAHYDFRYRAGWGAFRFGDYTHTVPATLESDGSLRLKGSMVLPGGFGTYEVEGRLTRDSFTATYQSEADHGTMTLQRPPPPRD